MADNVALKFVFPDGEHDGMHLGVRPDELARPGGLENLAQQAATRTGLTSPRGQQKKLRVAVYKQTIVDGVIKNTRLCQDKFLLPVAPRTQADFEADMQELLADMPPELHSFIGSKSWDLGHSAGLDEVISYAQELVSELKPGVTELCKRLQSGRTDG